MARARSLREFQTSFPDETSCAAFLFERRWPQGFVCPACGDGRAAFLRSRAHTYECLDCGRQTSITAGTVMHGSNLPLTVWFWAAHLMATHSNGMSAVQLEAQLGVTYKTAWLLAQKLRRSMIDPHREPLEGVVEVDQAEIPFRADNSFFDPVKSGKILIAGAVEVIDRGTNQAKRGRNERNTWILDLGASASPLSRTTRRLRSRPLCGQREDRNNAAHRRAQIVSRAHRLPTRPADGRQDGRPYRAALDSSSLRADETLGAWHLSWAAPQAHRHVSQRVCLPIQSALLPARLVRNHGRARLAPSPDELLGYRRARQSPQRRAGGPTPAAAPKDSDRHAGRPIKTPRKSRTQPRFGFHPPDLDIDQPGTTG